MKMYVGTEWSDRPRTVPVINPFDGSTIDTVPRGSAEDVDIATATRGAEEMARLPGYERYRILRRAAQPAGRAHRGVGTHHHAGRGQDHHRGPRRGGTRRPDHHRVRRGGEAHPWGDGPTGRRSWRHPPIRFHHARPLRRCRRHLPIQPFP